MSTTIINSVTIISLTSSLSKIIVLKAFTKYRNLVLRIPNWTTCSYVITDNALTIPIYDQVFPFCFDIWQCVYQFPHLETRKPYCINFVSEKIRLLNAETKTVEKILDLLKKDFVHLRLKKKNASVFGDSLAGFIIAICYYHSYQVRLAKLSILKKRPIQAIKSSGMYTKALRRVL